MALPMDRETADRGGGMALTMDRETADRIRAEAKRFMEDYYRTFALPMDRETADRGGGMALTMDRETADRIRAEAKRFMEDYYRTFDANRGDLVNLYREESVMNFDNREMIKGKEAIVAKLTSLQQFRYQISHIDCVAFAPTRGATAQIMGDIWVDGKPDALLLGQSFLLHPTPQGSFWIALQTWMTIDRSRMVLP